LSSAKEVLKFLASVRSIKHRNDPDDLLRRWTSASSEALSLATVFASIFAAAMLARPALAEPITLSIHRHRRRSRLHASDQSKTTRKANPQKIKEIKLQRAPAPEVPAKIKAQQDAGRLDINLIADRPGRRLGACGETIS